MTLKETEHSTLIQHIIIKSMHVTGKSSARNTHDLWEGVVNKDEDGEEGGNVCYLHLQIKK